MDGDPSKKRSASPKFTPTRQNDATAARTVRSGPPRGGGRRRPVSDGQSYCGGGGGNGRLRPTEPRPARPQYDVGNRQRLSSSEQMPMEVREVLNLHSYYGQNMTE